jgi:hypothetical protein
MAIEDFKNKKIPCNLFTSFNYDPGADASKGHLQNMICMIVDDYTMIVAGQKDGDGERPLSPNEYREKYKNSTFIIDESIEPKLTDTIHGRMTMYYTRRVD